MKKRFLAYLSAGLFAFFFAAPILSVATPVVSSTSAAACTDNDRFLGLPPWYRGLIGTSDPCNLKGPDGNDPQGLQKYIWKIVMNIIEMALVITVYIAVFFILYGGFQFMVGGNNPSMIEKGRKTILNAVIGLIISLGSVGIVNLLFSGIFGGAGTTGSGGIEGLVNLSGEQLLTNALNLTYFIAGIISVMVIIIAGVMYTISTGDSGRVAKAKNLLTYAIVGLVIVLTAFTITAFVTGSFSS